MIVMTHTEMSNIINAVANKKYLLPYCLEKNDLIQSAWLEVLSRLKEFEQKKGNLTSFICSIAYHSIVNCLAKSGDYKFRQYQEYKSGKTDFIHFDRSDDFVCYDERVDDFIRQDECKYIRKKIDTAKNLIKKISDLHLKCFELHFEQNYTVPQISKMLNLDFDKARGYCDYSLKVIRKEYNRLSRMSE